MALTAPTGLSAAQKARLERFDPTMDAANAIPASIAHKDDVTNVISDLASTAAGKGASCIGYEGGTTVQAQVAANTSAISALGGGGNTGFDAETAGAGGKMELYEATANGTNKVTMASPASLAADRTITVPDADVTLADIATNTAAIAAATTDTGAGAGNAGKLVELDGDGKLDGRDVGTDGAKLDGIEALADVTDLANVTTALGSTAAAAVNTSAGAGDAGKLAKLDASGKWDSTMIPAAAPAAHAASHTDGSDDIQDATNAQKGLATAAQITTLEAADSKVGLLERETGAVGALIQLFEATGNGTNKVTMQAPAALAADRTITVPDADVNLGDLTALGAAAATTMGIPRHIKVALASGEQDVDLSLANGKLTAGTWEVVDFYVVLRGAGSSADWVRLYKNGNGGTAISDQILINTGVDNQIYRATRLDDAYVSVVTGSGDYFTVTKRQDGDAPAVDAHIILRQIA